MGDDNNPIKTTNDVVKALGEVASEISKQSTSYFSKLSKSMADGSIPRLQIPDYSSIMANIEIPVNPMIETTQKMLEQIVLLNNELIGLHERIKSLEKKANDSASKNIRVQWTIGIVSAVVGALIGGIFALLVTGV